LFILGSASYFESLIWNYFVFGTLVRYQTDFSKMTQNCKEMMKKDLGAKYLLLFCPLVPSKQEKNIY
jgi:hypothetical protein